MVEEEERMKAVLMRKDQTKKRGESNGKGKGNGKVEEEERKGKERGRTIRVNISLLGIRLPLNNFRGTPNRIINRSGGQTINKQFGR